MRQYYDSSAFRISPGGYYINLLTQDICKGLCSELNLPFAGLMFGEYCLCSNHTTDLEEVNSNLCQKYCSGNPSEICGSDDIDIIYVLDAELMGTVDNIIITFEEETFSTDNPIKISLTVEASTDFFVTLHFGDGTSHKFSPDELYVIEKYYRIPGEYTIHASAVDIAQIQPAMFEEITIMIEDKRLNFGINCPVVVEPKMESQCNVTFFTGSSLSMTFQTTEIADQSDELYIPDPFYISVGLPIPSLLYEADSFSLNEKEVHLSYVNIPFKSYLIGFEFLVKTVGTLTFMILSPCSSDSYCEETYKCSSTCSTYNIRTCNDDKVLCSYIAQCINVNSPLECNLEPSSDLTYDVKFSFDVTLKNEGNDYYSVTEVENYVVLPGDIIGFKTDGTSALWCRNATAAEIQNGFEDKSPASSLGVRHYLRAIFSEAVNISLQYMYNDIGNQSISVSASNLFYEEPVTKKGYLPVQIPVSGVYLELNAINAIVGKNIYVNVKIVNGSDLTVIWDYFGENEEELFPGIPPEEGYSKDILCTTSGDYVIKVNVSNLWASEVVSSDFHCLSAITRDWSLTSDSPKFAPPGKITFNLKFDGTSLPGLAMYVSDFGDGLSDELIEISSDSESWTTSFSHNYKIEGSYVVLTNISNPVDFEIFEITVQIVKKMGVLSVVPYYALPESYPNSKMELRGPNKTDAPVNSTIYFENSITGEVSKFIMNSDDFTLNQESTDGVIFHYFSKIGEYILHFKAYDSELDEYSNEVTVKVKIINMTTEIDFIVSNVAVQTEEIVEFTISLSYFDLVSCIIFKSGDNSKFLAFGNEETCILYYPKSSFTYYPNFVITDFRKRRDVTIAEWKDDSTISILYIYATEGEFTALVDIFNAANRESKSTVITVVDGEYLRPIVWIDENSTDVTNPVKKQRGYDFQIDTTAVFQSNQSYVASHLWTAVKINESEIEGVIDLTELKTHNCSAIRITKRFLELGLYKFMYTLTVYEELEVKAIDESKEEELYEDYYTKYIKDEMDDKKEEIVNYETMTILGQRTIYTYIKIIPTPLIPMIIQGGASYIVRGFFQSVELEPTILTRDLDYPDEGEYVITWFCSRYDKNEKLTALGEYKYDTSNPSSPIEDRSGIKEDNKGGCFGKGPGLMEIGKGDYKLECNILWGYNATYDIVAVIEKSGKVTENHLYVEVIEKNPPNLKIMCEKNVVCFPQVHGQYINPNSFIPLKAECIKDCGEKGDLSLKWKIYASDLTTLAKNTIEDWKSHTIIDYDRIGLNQSLFHSYPELKIFLIEVTGVLPNPTIPKGISYIHLIINNPPDTGECKINASSGMALLDVFSIKFSNWNDIDGHPIVDYSIYVKYGDESLRLSYGLKTQVQVILPYGDLEVWCSVEDNIGAVTLYSAANFSTSLPSEEDLVEYEQQKYFEKYLAEGKMAMACQAVIAKNSITLEYKRKQNILGNFDGVSEAEIHRKWEGFLNQKGIDSSYFTIQAKDEIREILTEQLEIQQDEEAKTKNRELTKLLRLPMECIADAEIIGGAFATLANNGPSDLSAKLKLMEGMDNMFEVINHTEVSHPEDLKVVLSQFGRLANSIAGSLADSNIGGNFLPSELKKAQDKLDYNATEPNYFIFYVDGNRQEVQNKLYDRTVEAARDDQSGDTKEMVGQIKEMMDEIQKDCMEDLMVGPEPFCTESKGGFQMTLLKNYASNLTGKKIQQGDSSFVLPDLCQAMGSEGCQSNDIALGVQSLRWTQPLESYGKGSENLSDTSNVLEIDITPRNGSSIIPISNTKEPFIICIPQSNSASSGKKMKHVTPKFSRSGDILVYHSVFVDSPGIAVIVNILPDDPTAPLVLLFKYRDKPSLQDYDNIMKISDLPSENGVYNLVIGAEFIAEAEKNLSIAIGHFENTTKIDEFFEKPEQYNLTVANMTNEFTSNYSIAIALTGCYYFDEEEESWSTKGCNVSSSNSKATCCACNHLTSFGSGFFVAPNSIDFDYVFANTKFKNNITIYVTVIVLFSMFILFLIYARWKDRKDLQKIGATPLPDNEPADKYIYEMLVFTGHQRNAGTKSNIFFILSGEDDETEVRHLADDERSILQKGSIDVFVMSVPQSLGQLNYLRIWHDNSGSGRWSSWYCQYIVFRDVQTGLKYEFLVDRWFALEQDDGLIDRLIPVAGKEQMTEFSHLFSTNSRRNLADNHLWLSIFLRPPRSRFTRVQRVSCCMAVLCLSMLASVMYYERTSSVSTGGFKFGPFSLTPEQIAVGFGTNMLIFPPTFIMIFFFRKSRPRQLRPSRIELALKKQKQEWKKKNPVKSIVSTQKNVPTDAEAQWLARKKRKFSLPWWCVFFGWLFVFASIGSSLFFIWAYGIEFGDEKTSDWLTSLVISFISSILVTQPIKVILMAIFVSCICRSVDHDEDDADEDEDDPHLQCDEEYLHDGKQRAKKLTYRPMDLEALEEARKEREKEVKMYSLIREISAYFIFLWVITILSYGNRDPNNFYLREALINGFIKPGDLYVEFNNVNTEKRFWNWTYNALVPELFAFSWYNNRSPLGLRLFLDDRNNVKIGYGVLRQVRIQPRSCKVFWLLENVTPECAGFGSIIFEDQTLYTKSWRRVNSSDTLIPPEYKYLTASQLKGYPFWGQLDWYSGGGYVVPLVSRRDSDVEILLKKLKRLERDGWIDRHTRAVFVEFGIYNAQINLFCAVTIVAEFLPGGGIVPYYHIDPIRLLNYHTGSGLFQMAIEIIFVIFTIYFTVKEISNLKKQGMAYFKEVWNILELVSIIVSYTGIANHVYKLFMTAEILRIFTETKGTGYVKLQEAVLLNELFCYQIGLIISISTLKFLKLLRFNKRIGVLSSTLRMCGHELKSYSVCLMIVFVAFVILFWLLLGRYVREFSTFVYSFESSISMMLKKFNYEDMYAAQPIFTPIAFFIFSLATAVVLVNILLSIIIRSFENVKHDVSLQSNEYEIFDFFINRMKLTFGCGSAKVCPLPNIYKDKKKTKDTVSSFPDKVDKLVDFINDFYFENQIDFNSKEFLKKINSDIARANKKFDQGKKKAKLVKASKSKIPKNVSDRFEDF